MADATLKADLMSSDNQHTVGQVQRIIGNLMAAHGQDLSAPQQQQLQQIQADLSHNSAYYQQNPGALQRIFNTLLGIAAPFVLGYGITHILNRHAADNGQVGGTTFFPGGAPSFVGAGIGALLGGALPGIVEGLFNNGHPAGHSAPGAAGHISTGTSSPPATPSTGMPTASWGGTTAVQGFQPDAGATGQDSNDNGNIV